MGQFERDVAAREQRERLRCHACDQVPKDEEKLYLLELVELGEHPEDDLEEDELLWCGDCYNHHRKGLEEDTTGAIEEDGREVCSCCKRLFDTLGVRITSAVLTPSTRSPPGGLDPHYTAPPYAPTWLCSTCACIMHRLNDGCLWPDLDTFMEEYANGYGDGYEDDYEYGDRLPVPGFSRRGEVSLEERVLALLGAKGELDVDQVAGRLGVTQLQAYRACFSLVDKERLRRCGGEGGVGNYRYALA